MAKADNSLSAHTVHSSFNMPDVRNDRRSDNVFGEGMPVTEAVDSSMSMKTRYLTVGILFVVNLLNYMDRYTIAGGFRNMY